MGRQHLARDIDQKLRVTAAVLGTVTIKDLAALFRRVNPATPFDVDRAHKWMQGRARPREHQVYEDWARLLDLGRSGEWIAECGPEAFLDAICGRHGHDRESLKRRLEPSGSPAGEQDRSLALAGTYACYSHAWSPYFRGRLIRGELTIASAPGAKRGMAAYSEALPTGRLLLEGEISADKRFTHLDLREPGGEAHFTYILFPSSPPISVLGGLMCGATIIGPDSQPSVTRIAMVRLPGPTPLLRSLEAYLPPQGSVADDLSSLGLRIAEPSTVDERVSLFLAGGSGGLDQISAATYRSMVEAFDRNWLERPAAYEGDASKQPVSAGST